jgi:hypothetical protein
MVCETQIGGPACGDRGHDFFPGLFLAQGNTITSRGCPNGCWFCSAWRTEGSRVRELPIMPGFNVCDNNLLACSRSHIVRVFQMLENQKRRAHFTGGLEAGRLEQWHVDWFVRLKPEVMWFAYDIPGDLEVLSRASTMLREAGLMTAKHRACCYVLAGWNRAGRADSIKAAERRVLQVVALGFFPQAMLMDDGRDWPYLERQAWKKWAAQWINKRTVGKRMKMYQKQLQEKED